MYDLQNKQVLVTGLGARGRAACETAARQRRERHGGGIRPTRRICAPRRRGLRALGVEVELGTNVPPNRQFSFAVVSPAVPANNGIVQELTARKVPVIGELELGYQQSRCLNIAIAGTNGKGTTAELVECVLVQNPAQGGVVRARVAAGVFGGSADQGPGLPGVAGSTRFQPGKPPIFSARPWRC